MFSRLFNRIRRRSPPPTGPSSVSDHAILSVGEHPDDMLPIGAPPLVAAHDSKLFRQDVAIATVDGQHPDDSFAVFETAAATVGTERAVDSDGGPHPLPASVETVTPKTGVVIDRGEPSLIVVEEELSPTRPVADSRSKACHGVGTTEFEAWVGDELARNLHLDGSAHAHQESEEREPPTLPPPSQGGVGVAASREWTPIAPRGDDRQAATPQATPTDATPTEIASDLGPDADFGFDDFAAIAEVPANAGIGVPIDDAVFIDNDDIAARPAAATAPNWRVAVRAVAIVDALGIVGRARRARAFDRIVALLERFPHPASSRAMEGLADAGATLEMIEEAANLKEALREDGTLALLRRFSRATSSIVFVGGAMLGPCRRGGLPTVS